MTYSYLNYDSSYLLDYYVPSTPTNLAATAGNTQVSLTWSAPSDGGSALLDYVIQYSLNDTDWTTFADGTTTNTSTTVTGLVNDTLYYFRVRAQNAVGYSSYTSSVTATPLTGAGKKLLFTTRINKIQFTTKVRGQLRTSHDAKVKVNATGYQIVESKANFKGTVTLSNSANITGKSSFPTVQEYTVTGKSKLPVVQEILVTGKKDFTSLIGVLNKYIINDTPDGYLKRIIESV